MELDLAAALAAEEPFVVVLPNGTRHTAKPLSWPAYQRVEAAGAGIQAAEDAQAFDVALRAAFRAAFPARWHYILRPGADPVNHLMALGPGLRQRAVADFFAWAGKWRRNAPRPEPTNGPNGNGPSSAAPTP